MPRQVRTLPVTVVDLDQKSVRAVGQWPWPGTELARLIDIINRAEPAAIGLNLMMPEADALSPERVLRRSPVQDPAAVAVLRSLPSNDAVLARALAAAPAVLAIAGTPEATSTALRTAPIIMRGPHASPDGWPAVARYAGVLSNIDILDRTASGRGLISADSTRGIVRRIPLVADVQGTPVPALAIEMLRVASRQPALQLTTRGVSVSAVAVGGLSVPTEPDGAVRVYFSPHRADRFVSAVDVLQGKVDPLRLQRQLVLIGATALGLGDVMDTPIGQRMSGSEIQSQLLESLLEGTLLLRPAWAPAAEALLLLALGATLVWTTPRWKPWRAAALIRQPTRCALRYSPFGRPGRLMATVAVLMLLGASIALRSHHLLLDAATPGLYLLMLFGLMLVLTLTESARRRSWLEGVVQEQRESSARVAGELEAAQRIQTGSLPREDLLHGDHRIDLYATLTPAREVGGDLYDFFMLDDQRLFLLIGDVAGKGLAASIFMAVSKALYKGSMLRAPKADIGEVMSAANEEVSRDNAEMLFITLFAAILDLGSGELSYCNAGYDNPWRLRPGSAQAERIEDGDGPPRCVLSGFEYRSARRLLVPGDLLCLMTDGVLEAQNLAGELYGQSRAQRLIADLGQCGAGPCALASALQADVRVFADGAEPSDDMTIVALRWNGPPAKSPEGWMPPPASLGPESGSPP